MNLILLNALRFQKWSIRSFASASKCVNAAVSLDDKKRELFIYAKEIWEELVANVPQHAEFKKNLELVINELNNP